MDTLLLFIIFIWGYWQLFKRVLDLNDELHSLRQRFKRLSANFDCFVDKMEREIDNDRPEE